MDFEYSDKVKDLQARLNAFMDEHIYPNERLFFEQIEENTRAGKRWTPAPVIEELKAKARAAGLWNLFLPKSHGGELTNLEYAPLCEIMGRVHLGARGLQLLRARHRQHGDAACATARRSSRRQWLEPLLAGEIRSCFAMTEPDVASSDATNIQCAHRARRRPLRHQRPQVVVVGRDATRAASSSSSWARPIRTPRATRSSR